MAAGWRALRSRASQELRGLLSCLQKRQAGSTLLLHTLQCMHLFAPSLGFEIQQHLSASHLTPLQCMYLFAPRVLAWKSSSTSLLHASPVYAPVCTQSLSFEIQQHLTTPHLSSVCTCLHPVSASKSSSTSLLHTSRLSSVCTYLHSESQLRNPAAPRYSTPLQCMSLFAPRVSASKSSSTPLLHASPVYAPVCTQSLGFEIRRPQFQIRPCHSSIL
ncbi:uncharacterized protein AAEQ78_014749 [Lycaon pictus]